MIEHGHRHRLVPVSVRDRPDGRQIHSRCVGSPTASPTDGCTLEQDVLVRDGRVVSLRYRFGGLWFAPLDLLRLPAGIGVEVCPDCDGRPGLVACERCLDAGVVADGGGPLPVPDLSVR